ncbi:reverse transcriptase family protein [Sphingomonas sp. BGYR3]|uniref:reverse transcriptase family protein n=1 Tax=Sphingomonas sp. BGYR3 TaxID=2975483 RepID=UPI0021A504D1|nr:reverse transcriptase family protein [Sphingomonas sp. BGYR3]MDG5488870.1 reverse transcriptase family protein [Sphingomonas sp. BGYR3]
MSSTVNRSTLLWAVGILQPVSAFELNAYLTAILPEGGSAPSGPELQRFLLEASTMRQVVRVSREPDLFSLTMHGNYYLSRAQRLSRDKERLFLLHDSWPGRKTLSLGDQDAGLGGEAPPQHSRTWIKGSGANKPEPCVPRVRSYWPRISRQLSKATGPLSSSSDTEIDLLSFATERQLELARGDQERSWDYTSIALSIGVSPRLLLQMAISPERHYRRFEIAKSGGGTRTIDAPRVFLKSVQKFVADYILFDLPVHAAVHSFLPGRSPITNAQQHVGGKWIGTIDIKNFFPSISDVSVEKLLADNGFDQKSCRALRRLCTYKQSIPQGAPTSPIIANAFLFEVDTIIASMAKVLDVTFTRYADDLTFSSNEKASVESVMKGAEQILKDRLQLRLNESKRRIAGPGARRVVTGATVSDRVLPSRKLRRNIRAAAFNQSRHAMTSDQELRRLEGYLSYFRAFPAFKDNEEGHRLTTYLKSARRRLTEDERLSNDPTSKIDRRMDE